MRRTFPVCAALLAAVALAVAADEPAPAQSGPVLVVGDSLVVGTTPHLRRELSGTTIESDGLQSRRSDEAVGVLRSRFSGEPVVVFDAGTNDDPAQPSRLSRSLSSARSITGDSCLVIATINRPPYRGVSVDGLNRAVRSFAASAPNVAVVDWRAVAVSRPELMNRDRVHPTSAGYAQRAKLFADAIRSCGDTGGGGGGVPPGTDELPPLESLPGGAEPPGDRGRRPRRGGRDRNPEPRPEPRGPAPKLADADAIFSNEPVTFASKGARLSGELMLPAAEGRHPAVVMLHDSGRATRAAYRDQAELLAQNGVAALIYDKRGAGQSTGNPDYRYSELADDAAAAIGLLRRREEVNAEGIGLWALGEGGYVAPLLASRDARVAAVLLASPSALSPASQKEWAVRNTLHAEDAGTGTQAVTTYYGVAADAGHSPVALGSRREADLDFDPAPVWRRVAQPVLAAWGTADSVVPPRASAEALAGALAAGDNEDRTFSTFSGAGHTLGVAKEGNAPGTAPGFQEQAVDWLHSRLGSTRPVPTVRTPLPPATEAVPVKRVSASLLSSWPVQLLWLLVPAVALMVMGVRALRARGGVDALAEAVDAPLRPWILPAVVVALDLAALAALAIAVASIVEADGRGVEALAGVPIVILVAWAISLLALAATVVLGRGAWRARRSGEPKPFRLGMTVASASWLLLLAYWLV